MTASAYYKTLRFLTQSLDIFDGSGKAYGLDPGFQKAVDMIKGCGKREKKLMFIGNGASASIASHMAVDFWKNAGIEAVAFNDASLLTCLSNDFGYEYVFSKPLEMFAKKGDMLVAISSSGKSKNILQAVKIARKKGCRIITLSGFLQGNPLSRLGDLNFYVPASEYGHVEIMHHSICHYTLNMIGKR
jgi:D-sedoheptulose 7-phosphate isomerase